MERDVIVVGAGPAGSLLSLLLARRGLRVLLVDAARRGRDKACGEGLMPRGVAVLQRAGLTGLLDGAPRLEGVALRFAGGVVEGRFRLPGGHGVLRSRFDAALVEEAAACGVEVRHETRAQAVLKDERKRPWLLLESGGRHSQVRGRVVVVADGGRSPLSRGAAAPIRPVRLGVVMHCDAEALPEALRRPAWVEALLAPSAQVVLTPVGAGVVSVAALLPRAARGAVAHSGGADALLELVRPGLRAVGLELPRRALGPPRALGLLAATAASTTARRTDGVLCVGDAAGAVDPVVGCGISLALASAERAAAAVHAALAGALPSRGRAPEKEPWAVLAADQRAALRPPRAVATLLLALAAHPRLGGLAHWLHGRTPRLADALLLAVAGQG